MDQQSFNKLMTGQWPNKIANISINVKQPRILPSEHSLLIYCVFKDWDILKKLITNEKNNIQILEKQQESSAKLVLQHK